MCFGRQCSSSVAAMLAKSSRGKGAATEKELAKLRKKDAYFPKGLDMATLKSRYQIMWVVETKAHPATHVVPGTGSRGLDWFPFFVDYFFCGLCPPFSEFFVDLMHPYGLRLLDFTPNADPSPTEEMEVDVVVTEVACEAVVEASYAMVREAVHEVREQEQSIQEPTGRLVEGPEARPDHSSLDGGEETAMGEESRPAGGEAGGGQHPRPEDIPDSAYLRVGEDTFAVPPVAERSRILAEGRALMWSFPPALVPTPRWGWEPAVENLVRSSSSSP
ncbi:hypothetical protein D1007_59954 [Hordeum vulgare]|nr:hypothetical protein D1007_59954 [Hordeum vulgare]